MLISRPTLNIIQMGVGFFLVFFAFSTQVDILPFKNIYFKSQGFIVETVLENRHNKDPRISSKAGYYRLRISISK